MIYCRILFTALLLACFGNSIGQSLSKNFLKYVKSQESFQLDTQVVVPGTISVHSTSGLPIPSNKYRFNAATGLFTWTDSNNALIQIRYRSFDFPISQHFYSRSPTIIQPKISGPIDPFRFPENTPKQAENPLAMGGLSRSGSIARSLSIGNAQNLTVNSVLDLQLNGKISDDIAVQAVISDNTLPIQPEGTTQQIQEFDKVFIRLEKKQQSLLAGDFELHAPKGYYLQFFKKTKGGLYTGSFTDSLKRNITLQTAIGIAKGKYARNTFLGQEGNQGPYRLKGNGGETFIVVLSGTERIYLDGKLLKRGQEYDYTINYNTAELSFTPKHLINQYSRISAEFEYSDKNFARSLNYLSADAQASRSTALHVHFYSEQDNKNQPLLQNLSAPEKQFLAGIGDNTAAAFYPNIDSISFSGNRILYRKIDSLGYKDVLVYSNDSNQAHYRANFTLVGSGKGNYRLSSNSAANGRVYEWVAPLNNQAQGDYEPVSLLIAPKKTQLLSMGLEQQLGKRTSIQTEWAISNSDINTFSGLDDHNNMDWAQRSMIKRSDSLGRRTVFNNRLSFEYDRAKFKPIERFQDAQFERDYNTALNDTTALQALRYRSDIEIDSTLHSFYSLEHLQKEQRYQGFRNLAGVQLNTHSYALNYTGSVLRSNTNNSTSNYFKQSGSLSKKTHRIVLGINGELEDNRLKDKTGDSLMRSSFNFYQYGLFLQSPDSNRRTFNLSYLRRFDQRANPQTFTPFSVSDNYSAESSIRIRQSQLRLGAAYRQLHTFNDPFIQKIGNGRVNYDFAFWKSAVAGNTYYESGIGQEPKRIISYLRVADGTGVYTWKDYNHNGVEELNEFELAPYRDQAGYIRLLSPSSESVRSANLKLSQSLRIAPANFFAPMSPASKWASFFENELSYTTDQKVLNPESRIRLNPWTKHSADSALVSAGNSYRNILYLNRQNIQINGDFSINGNETKLLLVNGFDRRVLKGTESRIRWMPSQASLIQLSYIENIRSYIPGYALSGSYRLYSRSIEPSLSISPTSSKRIGLQYIYKLDENLSGIETARNQSLGLETKFAKAEKGIVTINLRYIHYSYQGETNNNIAFELLQGLKPGNNLTWSVNLNRSLSEALQMTFLYEGRKSEDNRAIHTGSVQIRALF